MNARNLTVSTIYALYFGLVVIFMKLQLPGILWAAIFIIWPPLLRYWLIRRQLKIIEDAHKTNDTLFDEKIGIFTSVVMFIIAIGVTYTLMNHVFQFQPDNFACGVTDYGRRRAPSFQCTERLILTAIYCLTFFSLIAAMWSLARRYLVRDHWDEL